MTQMELSRRSALMAAAGAAGLMIGFRFIPRGATEAAEKDVFAPNAFIRIAPDSTVTVIVKHLDKGQGIATGLTSIVADELDADWAQMRFEFAPTNGALYGNILFGGYQGTGASTSTTGSWDQLRQAGAMARALIVEAAAKAWNVPSSEIKIDRGIVSAREKRAPFGEFVRVAVKEPVPSRVMPKKPDDYKFIGVDRTGMRLDSVAKTTGRAIFTIDLHEEGMKTVTVVRPLLFGARPISFNADEVKRIPGVVDAVIFPNGVAIIAEDMWSAIKGKRAVKAVWDESQAERRGSAEIMALYKDIANKPGDIAAKRGDAEAQFAAGGVIEAGFEFPYVAHAPLEASNITMQYQPGQIAKLLYGCQNNSADQYTIAAILGLKPEAVEIETVWAGGSFGRRSTTGSDMAAEIALIAKATNGQWPLKLQYLREDDMTGGWYRPLTYHRLRAKLGTDGKPLAWGDRIVTQSINKGTANETMMVRNGVDGMTVEGMADMPYAIPNFLVEVSTPKIGLPVNWWRSVGHSHTAFAKEAFMDELAHAAKQDPVAYRLALLGEHPRHRAVLHLAAEKAGWGKNLGKGQGQGVAVHESFGSYVAQVAEVTVSRAGEIKVDRIVCAVDCGIAVNPDIVRAQIEGAVGFALSAALRNEITLEGGAPVEQNFDAFQILRMSEMPKVEVHIVPSQEKPSGVGETGVPCVAPAVANAIFAATGQRVRTLPLSKVNLQWA